MATKPKKAPAPTYILPPGIAAFPHVEIPDVEGQYASNRFSLQVLWDGGTDLSEMRKVIIAAAKAEFGDKFDEDTFKFPFREHGDDDKKEELRGKITALAKSKFQPGVVDARRNPIKLTPYDLDEPPANPKRTLRMSGDKVRIMVTLYLYAKEEEETIVENGKRKKVKVTNRGCSLQLAAVQIIEKRAGGGGNNYAGGFGEVEGGYDASSAPPPDDDDGGDARGSGDSGDGDY